MTVPVPLPVRPSQTLADASQGLELVVVRVEHEGPRMAPQNAFYGLLARRVLQHEAPLDPAEVTGIRHRPGLERVPSRPSHLGVPLRVVRHQLVMDDPGRVQRAGEVHADRLLAPLESVLLDVALDPGVPRVRVPDHVPVRELRLGPVEPVRDEQGEPVDPDVPRCGGEQDPVVPLGDLQERLHPLPGPRDPLLVEDDEAALEALELLDLVPGDHPFGGQVQAHLGHVRPPFHGVPLGGRRDDVQILGRVDLEPVPERRHRLPGPGPAQEDAAVVHTVDRVPLGRTELLHGVRVHAYTIPGTETMYLRIRSLT